MMDDPPKRLPLHIPAQSLLPLFSPRPPRRPFRALHKSRPFAGPGREYIRTQEGRKASR